MINTKKMIFGGIDLAAFEKNPTACSLLDDSCQLVELKFCHSDSEMITIFQGSQTIGLDAPCSLPNGLHLCCMEDHPTCRCENKNPIKGRWAEHQLMKQGIRAYVISKNAFAKAWIRRGLRLKSALKQAGLPVLEVFPTGSKIRLFGNFDHSKISRAGRFWLQQNLRRYIPNIPSPQNKLFSHDELDAMLAAFTCYLHWLGQTEAVGDEQEGQIILPVRDWSFEQKVFI